MNASNGASDWLYACNFYPMTVVLYSMHAENILQANDTFLPAHCGMACVSSGFAVLEVGRF